MTDFTWGIILGLLITMIVTVIDILKIIKDIKIALDKVVNDLVKPNNKHE